MSSEVKRANIEVHTRMADSYNAQEPHFRPENQAKVRAVLTRLAEQCGGGRLLDIGCGTGFILKIAEPLFRELYGVDLTPAMLGKVERSAKVQISNASAESLPFAANSFDLVSAYSFIHHVEDALQVLREACRVLKPGGICYVDLEPNKHFWSAMERLPVSEVERLPAMMRKAYDSVVATDARVQAQFGIDKNVFNRAEYGKAVLGGVDAEAMCAAAPQLGFKSCAVRYEWFLGQADIMHGRSIGEAEKIESYLREIAPLSNHLFKYVQLIFVKA
jgi:ubiquinone/menaquinone biosynthesis C-methylase UbiE